jgi:hypothetical protein
VGSVRDKEELYYSSTIVQRSGDWLVCLLACLHVRSLLREKERKSKYRIGQVLYRPIGCILVGSIGPGQHQRAQYFTVFYGP